ncbi:hypothetical protein BpHYR1_038716 [Brachionus plicatilis]|uniref:Uncharacterized protein n=1 Tax=Brachionus plicatilis TaxID=10195 RepID=A0A3M7SA46_BRAPC|nr:hypothetical protein BpHYR1_038716 [Brachionus plicatilis]
MTSFIYLFMFKYLIVEEKKEEIVRKQLHNGVGYPIYLDSKLSLYSSLSLTISGTNDSILP